MAIALVASALLGSGVGHSTTFSYTVGAGSALVVTSIVSAQQITAGTYGGNALTLSSVQDTVDATWVTLAYLLNPPTGANTFAFTAAGGSLTAFAADYSGVGSADGAFVANNESGSTSLTTNVALANANEWVICAAITGHLTNTFSTTTNQTVRQQDQGFLSGALYDSGTGFGPGTVGFVTTITGTSPRMWVVMQAFKATAAGTTITAVMAALSESMTTQTNTVYDFMEVGSFLPLDNLLYEESLGLLREDLNAVTEALATLNINYVNYNEALAGLQFNETGSLEFVIRLEKNNAALQEFLQSRSSNYSINSENRGSIATNSTPLLEISSSLIQVVSNEGLLIETTTAESSNQPAPLEIASSNKLVLSNAMLPFEFNSTAIIGQIIPLEVSSANKLILSNTKLPVESLGYFAIQAGFTEDVATQQTTSPGVSEEWLLAINFNSTAFVDAQKNLTQQYISNLESSASLSITAPALLEYTATTHLVVGSSSLPLEVLVSITGDQQTLTEISHIVDVLFPLRDEFSGVPLSILLSSIGRLARSVKIRLSEPTIKVRLLGPKTRSPR